MTTRAEGTFENKGWDESTVSEFDDAKISHASVKQSFSGVIEGDADVDWHMYYAPDGTATFVGMQRIVGAIDDRKGSVVIQSTGVYDGKEAKGDWVIVGATAELTGLRGTGAFSAPMGPNGKYSLSYDL
jgi:Protein of unknown function (DUF3224)